MVSGSQLPSVWVLALGILSRKHAAARMPMIVCVHLPKASRRFRHVCTTTAPCCGAALLRLTVAAPCPFPDVPGLERSTACSLESCSAGEHSVRARKCAAAREGQPPSSFVLCFLTNASPRMLPNPSGICHTARWAYGVRWMNVVLAACQCNTTIYICPSAAPA